MLPQYNRLGGPITTRRSFHSREKCLIALVLATLVIVCFGGFFLLPDNFGGERVLKVYKQIQKAGPEIFIPAPPLAGHSISGKDDPHVVGDRQKLQEKIQQELDDILDRPDLAAGDRNKIALMNNKFDSNDGGEKIANQQEQVPVPGPPEEKAGDEPVKNNAAEADDKIEIVRYDVNGHEDQDPGIRVKRIKVKEVSG